MLKEIKLKATRDSYGETLVELGHIHKDMVVLDADLAKATKTEMFMKKFPERFFDCGIAECNMMGIAAGLASTGKIVFASSFAMFAVGRAFEIIRNSIGYPNLNVKIAATHAGVSVGEDGATHQCCEDIGLMRTIPSMVIMSPSDDLEARFVVKKAVDIYGPVYIRLGRLAVPSFNNEEDYSFEFGKGIKLREGRDITIIATGLMVYKAVEAHNVLKTMGINSRVVNIHTIKPIDKDIILDSAKHTGLILTAEEHNIIGGLGSAVCEVVCDSDFNVPVFRLGVNDSFGMSGSAVELLDHFGLSSDNIVNITKKLVYNKKN